MRTFLIATAAILAPAAPAWAIPSTDAPRIEIARHGDLDLSSAAGRERLDARLRRATQRACSDPGAVRLDRQAVSRCEHAALARGRATAELQTMERVQLAALPDG